MSSAETYLQENNGYWLVFVEHRMNDFSVGASFVNALSTVDIYELRNAGLFFDVYAETAVDSPKILEAITFLREKNGGPDTNIQERVLSGSADHIC